MCHCTREQCYSNLLFCVSFFNPIQPLVECLPFVRSCCVNVNILELFMREYQVNAVGWP